MRRTALFQRTSKFCPFSRWLTERLVFSIFDFQIFSKVWVPLVSLPFLSFTVSLVSSQALSTSSTPPSVSSSFEPPTPFSQLHPPAFSSQQSLSACFLPHLSSLEASFLAIRAFSSTALCGQLQIHYHLILRSCPNPLFKSKAFTQQPQLFQ